jgi:hypothetical protein
MTDTDWKRGMAAWLEEFSWQWFCSFTFRPYYTVGQRKARMRIWVGELKASLGTENFGWIAVPEWGRTGQDFHYHVLVTGLRDWSADNRLRWMKRWRELAGDALITVFHEGAGGIEYILKHAGPSTMDQIEFELSDGSRMQTTFDKK